jgi:hypothetical protein
MELRGAAALYSVDAEAQSDHTGLPGRHNTRARQEVQPARIVQDHDVLRAGDCRVHEVPTLWPNFASRRSDAYADSDPALASLVSAFA